MINTMVFGLVSIHEIELMKDKAFKHDGKKKENEEWQVNTTLLDFSTAINQVPLAKCIELLKFYGHCGSMLNQSHFLSQWLTKK